MEIIWNYIHIYIIIYTYIYIYIYIYVYIIPACLNLCLWMSLFHSFAHLLHFFVSEQLPDKTGHLPEPWHRAKTARETERHHQKTSGVFAREALSQVNFSCYLVLFSFSDRILSVWTSSVAGLSNWGQGLQLPCCRPHSHQPGGRWGLKCRVSAQFVFLIPNSNCESLLMSFSCFCSRGVGASRDEER